MQIERKGFTLIIYSQKLCDFISRITGFGTKAKAITIFPVIIVKNKQDPKHKQYFNHELIHIAQSRETFCLIWFVALFEYIYARLFLKYSHMQAYKYECVEQEAYSNMENLKYLKTRKRFSTFNYLKSKKLI